MTKLSKLSVQNLSFIFNQRDARKRRAALNDLWDPNGVLWSAEGTYVGRRAIEQAVARLLRQYPEFEFAAVGETDEIPDAVRMRWSFGTLGSPPAITGLDVIVVSGERISAMYRFLDGAGL